MALWRRERAKKRENINSRGFWNGFDLWEAYEPYTGYPGELMAPISGCIDGHTTVLDVGAGSGGLALPMALAADRVTAVEPSFAQCERLRRKGVEWGVNNLVVVEKAWEEVSIEALGRHDIVTAGYCLFMEDIQEALWKMYRLARKKIFLVHLAHHDLQKAMDRILGCRIPFPDQNMLFNVLKELGWEVRSRVFTRNFELPLALQMSMFRYSQGFDDREVKRMEDYLQKAGRIFMRRGEAWVRRQYGDALISVSN